MYFSAPLDMGDFKETIGVDAGYFLYVELSLHGKRWGEPARSCALKMTSRGSLV